MVTNSSCYITVVMQSWYVIELFALDAQSEKLVSSKKVYLCLVNILLRHLDYPALSPDHTASGQSRSLGERCIGSSSLILYPVISCYFEMLTLSRRRS